MVEFVLEGGKRVRKIRPSPRSWTKAKERAFIAALAESCNVKLAAKTAKVSASAIYVRRSRDASFRRAWDQALAAGYAQLEMVMLERALHGVEKTIVLRSGETRVMREYSDRVGLALLKMHREGANYADADEVDNEEQREACERIVARLERLRQRDSSADDDQPVETKSSGERLGLLRWAFRQGPGETANKLADAA